MIHTLTAMVSSIELLTEITAAGVLLMVLDRLAAAVRFTYAAGRFTGHLWFTYVVPAILWTADQLSWLIAQIDWIEVASVVGAMLRTITALIIAAVLTARETFTRWHADHVGTITWTTPAAPVAPHVQPLALIADELSEMSCSQLRRTFGMRQRYSRQRLIATALAC